MISRKIIKRNIQYISAIIIAILMSGLFVQVNAQDSEPTLDSGFEYSFGEELRFLLQVKNGAAVERITLSFRPELATEVYRVDVPFETRDTISVTFPVDVAMIGLEPYSRLKYSWQVETNDGLVSLPDQVVIYDDDQFEWKQMNREAATVHWTGNGPSFGGDVLNIVDEAVMNIAEVIPLQGIVPFDVYIYPSAADLRSGIESAGLDGSDASHPELGVVLVTAVNPQSAATDLGQSIPYEVAQLLIYQAAGDRFETFPWWLSEGLGLTFQATVNPTFEQVLDEAVENESTIALWQLCQPPSETGHNEMLGQAQSASTIAFIRNQYGDAKLKELVRSSALGNDCQAGIERALDMDLDQLESAWFRTYRSPSGLEQFIMDYGLWILILLAGFAGALLLIRYSTRSENQG